MPDPITEWTDIAFELALQGAMRDLMFECREYHCLPRVMVCDLLGVAKRVVLFPQAMTHQRALGILAEIYEDIHKSPLPWTEP